MGKVKLCSGEDALSSIKIICSAYDSNTERKVIDSTWKNAIY